MNTGTRFFWLYIATIGAILGAAVIARNCGMLR